MRLWALAVVAMLAAGPVAAAEADRTELVFWQSIQDSTTPGDYAAYLETYPDGAFAALARARLAQYAPAAPQQTAAPAAGAAPDVYDALRMALYAGDYGKALAALRPAAEAGDTLAQTLIAMLYMADAGPPLNLVVARAWLEEAAAAGDINAMMWLGNMHKDRSFLLGGEGRIGEMWPEAARWYRRAAEAGSAEGMFRLGVIHRLGVLSGVLEVMSRDAEEAEARRWLEAAAGAGHPQAQQVLAMMMRDSPRFRELLEASAAGPEGIEAQSTLAIEPGGVTDPARRYFWLLVAQRALELTRQPRTAMLDNVTVDEMAERVAEAGAALSAAERAAAAREAEAFTEGWVSPFPGGAEGG